MKALQTGSGLDFNIKSRLDLVAKAAIRGRLRRHRLKAPAEATATHPNVMAKRLQSELPRATQRMGRHLLAPIVKVKT